MSVPPRYSESQTRCVTVTLHPVYIGWEGGIRNHDLALIRRALWPTELLPNIESEMPLT